MAGRDPTQAPLLLLPGIILPAAIRYAPLLSHLQDITAVTKELEVYASDEPPPDFSIALELEAVDRVVEAAGWDTFHLYGHSAGGAVALAYAASRGDRVASLAVDEPAGDFTEAGAASYGWHEFDEAAALPEPAATRAFLTLQVAPGVEVPAPPPGSPPPWMAKRPAGIRAFIRALRSHRIDPDRYRAFRSPVYFTRGGLTHPRWLSMEQHLSTMFPVFSSEVYEGVHHLNTSHQAEPERVATALRNLWTRARR